MPGDHLRLVCEQEASLCVDRVIAVDGTVSLPLVGAVSIAAKRVAEAELSLSAAAARLFPGARITIALLPSKSRPIQFGGVVKVIGETPYRKGIRLGDIIALAQPTSAADMQAIAIQDAAGRVTTVDWLNAIGDVVRNPEMRSGDIVTFTLRNRPIDVLVLGGVEKPGALPFVPGMNIQRAIALAGGLSARGHLNGVVVERKGEAAKAYDLGKAEDTELRPGDAVKVPVRVDIRYISVQGAVKKQGAFDYRDGMTLTQAIALAGGLATFADAAKIEIRSTVGKRPTRADLGAILRRTKPDIVLNPNDAIIVPYRAPGGG
jgi:polysaccharide biosynthesis/export protein